MNLLKSLSQYVSKTIGKVTALYHVGAITCHQLWLLEDDPWASKPKALPVTPAMLALICKIRPLLLSPFL